MCTLKGQVLKYNHPKLVSSRVWRILHIFPLLAPVVLAFAYMAVIADFYFSSVSPSIIEKPKDN